MEERDFDKREIPDNKLLLRNRLNIAFMVLAVLTVVLYILPMPYGKIFYFGAGVLAVVIKMIEVTIRQSIYKKRKNDKRGNHSA